MSPTPDQIGLLLTHTPPFSVLPDGARTDVLEALLMAFYEAGEHIIAQGSDDHAFLYLVISGHVHVRTPSTHQLIDAHGQGDVFGSIGLLQGGVTAYEVVAVAPTRCALLPADQFHRLYSQYPTFGAFFRGSVAASARTLHAPEDLAGPHVLFQTPMRQLVQRGPVQCAPDTTAQAAARTMRDEHVGSILVVVNDQAVGILTNNDLRNKIIAEGQPLATPVADLMNSPVITHPADAPVLHAWMTLMQHRIHHIVLTEADAADSPVVGVLSDKDILRVHGYNPVALIKRIQRAASVSQLLNVRAELNQHLVHLHRLGMRTEDLIALNTEVNDRLTVRVLDLVHANWLEKAPAPVAMLRWAWISLGSEGREEMSLKTDQDNSLIYEQPSAHAEAHQAHTWFLQLAEAANEALAACGFILCQGEVMARNPKWCQPLPAWKQTFRRWILEPDPKALMHASIFFDLRHLYGDESLVNALLDDLKLALRDERGFLPFMMHNAQTNKPPLSFFKRFVLERSGEHRNTFDVKLRGLMPIVDVARVLALEHGYFTSTNTLDRLEHVASEQPESAETANNASDAYRYLIQIRLTQHLEALEANEPLHNHIDPSKLTKVQQQMLKAVFGIISDMQEVLSHRYGADMMR